MIDEGKYNYFLAGFAVRMRSTGAHVLVLLEYDWRRGDAHGFIRPTKRRPLHNWVVKWIENDRKFL